MKHWCRAARALGSLPPHGGGARREQHRRAARPTASRQERHRSRNEESIRRAPRALRVIADMPFDDRTPQDEIDRRRAERLAREATRRSIKKRKRLVREEKKMFPNLTGDFDEESPFAKHFTRERDH